MESFDKSLWQSLSPLLDKALDLEPSAQHDLIADLHRESPALADALSALLADCDRMRVHPFLETPIDVEDNNQPSIAGCRVGGYTLERPIGAGGMGAVWLARRSDGRFEGSAAVKLLNLSILARLGEERFRREGSMLARLSHPNIARLLDAGVTAAGQPYLVLEYVEGLRIDRYAADHRLGIGARIDLFLQVDDAVAHAHANLVVHRDLKPSNILVDAGGRAKLLDFGIATFIEEESTVTLTGRALTPEYAAPEQAIGRAVTTAMDVYAMGVLLYQLLVGRHPTAPDGATDAVVLKNLIEVDPLRLSETAAGLRSNDSGTRQLLEERATTRERLIATCRGDLDTIVAKALKKDSLERYQTVAALAEDVRRYLRHEPVSARPDSAWYRWRKFAARRRLELAAAAAVVVALVVGTGIAVRQARLSAGERDRALEQLRRAEATNDLSAFLLSEARPGQAPISNSELLVRGEKVIDRRFAGDPVLRTHMLLILSDRYFENQQFEAWRRVLDRANADARRTGDPVLQAETSCAWAAQLIEQEKPRDALATILAAEPAVAAPEHADVAAFCSRLESRAAQRSGDAARGVRAAQRAVDLETRRGAPGNRLLDALTTLALADTAVGDYAGAVAAYHRAESVIQREGLDATLEYAVVLNNWSVMMQSAGQHRTSAALSERAVNVARQADSENGASLTMLAAWGNALTAIGDFARAKVALDESLVKARAAGSAPRLLNTLFQALVMASEAGDVESGSRFLAEGERALTDSSPALLKAYVEIGKGRLALASGHPQEAVDRTKKGLDLLTAANPAQSSLVPTQTFLARSLNASGRFSEALEYAGRSVAVSRERLGGFRYSSTVGSALLEQATADRGLGHHDQARAAATEALEHLIDTLGPQSITTVRAQMLLASLAAPNH